jgi:radical SAM superfamily enzyme YgiQ (UPF0313 family)
MRALLISTYELGHQPLHVASPAGALRGAGHDVRCLDLAVQPLDPKDLGWAEVVGLSVPMHTAMRLALGVAGHVREERPEVPVCFYGLYAPVSRDLTVGRLADRVIGGEYEPELVRWVDGLDVGGPSADPVVISLEHGSFSRPARDLLPPLDRYAHLLSDDEHRLVGYVEASHGCSHRCRHCPVPTVYDGRTRVASPDAVLEDVASLVEMGARHITFGDPDFFNGVPHSLRVVRAVHERFPELTFDCTVKVEHILRHESVWAEMAASGCLFVISAFEILNDEILARLDKGHTRADATRAISLLREHGIEIRPSFLPFTPWTALEDVVDILDFIIESDLVDNVDPVQLSIRLLLPEGSLLLDHPDIAAHLEGYDASLLTYRWRAADPRVDELSQRVARVVESGVTSGEDREVTFRHICETVYSAAGLAPPGELPARVGMARPHITEPWFC